MLLEITVLVSAAWMLALAVALQPVCSKVRLRKSRR